MVRSLVKTVAGKKRYCLSDKPTYGLRSLLEEKITVCGFWAVLAVRGNV
jgi:hypothetical protein